MSDLSKWLQISMLIVIFAILNDQSSYAESKIFSGITTSLSLHKACKDASEKDELVFVFNGELEGVSSGWFYGKSTSVAELRSTAPLKYEVIYPATIYDKLPPSHMELIPIKDGYQAIIKDFISENKELQESACYFERMEVNIKPEIGSAISKNELAKELFAAELTILEGMSLWEKQGDNKVVETMGYKALATMERIFGKLSKQSINAAGLIALGLFKRSRYDEALEILSPYYKLFPEDAALKEFIELLKKEKQEQDELFKYNPNSNEDIAYDSLA